MQTDRQAETVRDRRKCETHTNREVRQRQTGKQTKMSDIDRQICEAIDR